MSTSGQENSLPVVVVEPVDQLILEPNVQVGVGMGMGGAGHGDGDGEEWKKVKEWPESSAEESSESDTVWSCLSRSWGRYRYDMAEHHRRAMWHMLLCLLLVLGCCLMCLHCGRRHRKPHPHPHPPHHKGMLGEELLPPAYVFAMPPPPKYGQNLAQVLPQFGKQALPLSLTQAQTQIMPSEFDMEKAQEKKNAEPEEEQAGLMILVGNRGGAGAGSDSGAGDENGKGDLGFPVTIALARTNQDDQEKLIV